MAKLKLNQELQTNLCNYIKKGIPIIYSCQLVGITRATYYNWYDKGTSAKSGKFKEFVKAVEQAKAVAIAEAVQTILTASEKDWKAAAWYLERIAPNEFTKKDNINIKSENMNFNKHTTDLNNLFDEDLIDSILKEEEEYKKEKEVVHNQYMKLNQINQNDA